VINPTVEALMNNRYEHMTPYVHWNRRSGIDRRQLQDGPTTHQRGNDRRQLPDNDFSLIVGRTGLGSFELLVAVSVTTLVFAMAAGTYLGNI